MHALPLIGSDWIFTRTGFQGKCQQADGCPAHEWWKVKLHCSIVCKLGI